MIGSDSVAVQPSCIGERYLFDLPFRNPFSDPYRSFYVILSLLDHRPNSTFNSSTAVFSYHRICQAKKNANTSFTCFRDLNYLCICEPDHHRAECFGYNRSIDQCSLCLSNEYCLKGELNDTTNFRCLDSHYYNGSVSQHNTQSSTLQTLLTSDMTSPLLGGGATFSPLPFFSHLFLLFFFILCHA